MRRLAAVATLGLAVLAAPAGARDRGADGVFDERTSSHFRLLQDVDLDRSTGPSGSRRFEIEVLSDWPIHTQVRQSGWYADGAGNRFCRLLATYHIYAGAPFVELPRWREEAPSGGLQAAFGAVSGDG